MRMYGLLARRRRPHDLQEGDYVLWDYSSHTTIAGQRKSRARWEGSYRIRERKGSDTFVLEGLPSGIPATQNVSKLYPFFYSPDKFKYRLVPGPPQPDQAPDGYEISSILDHRQTRKRREFLVKWVGYVDPTWIREPDLVGAADLLHDYLEQEELPVTERTPKRAQNS